MPLSSSPPPVYVLPFVTTRDNGQWLAPLRSAPSSSRKSRSRFIRRINGRKWKLRPRGRRGTGRAFSTRFLPRQCARPPGRLCCPSTQAEAGRHSQDLWGQIAGRSPFLPFDANRRNGPKFYNQLVSLARPLVELINLAVSLLSLPASAPRLLTTREGRRGEERRRRVSSWSISRRSPLICRFH